MKIAVGIIGILLSFVVTLQSCAVGVGGELMADQSVSEVGAVGVFVGFFFMLGGAFAFGLPGVSMVVFGIASLVGLGAGASGVFTDLTVWGVVAGVLALLSFFAWRGQRKAKQATSGPQAGPEA